MKRILGIALSCALLFGLLCTVSLADTFSKEVPLLGVLLDGPTETIPFYGDEAGGVTVEQENGWLAWVMYYTDEAADFEPNEGEALYLVYDLTVPDETFVLITLNSWDNPIAAEIAGENAAAAEDGTAVIPAGDYAGAIPVDKADIGEHGRIGIAGTGVTVRALKLASGAAAEPSDEPSDEASTEPSEAPVDIEGDADGDGDVTMKDVLAVRKFIAKLLDSIDETAADVNGDGHVDMKDVLLIRKFIANIIDSFEREVVPTTTTTTTTTTTPTTTTTTTPEPEPFFTYETDRKNGSLGVWWWDCRTGIGEDKYKPRLDFLQNNHTTEIYLWVNPSQMSFDATAEFIRQAAARGMRVAWLSGDVSWIREGNTGFETFFSQFKAYQDQAADDAKFYGIHLDVEPHQAGSSDSNWQLYADLVLRATAAAHEYGTVIEWDIPFWLDDKQVTANDSTVRLLDLLAQNSDTLCLMAYRDTAAAILSVSEQEIPLGTAYNCKIVLGVETYSLEGEYVSFREDGKGAMYNALAAVLTDLSGRTTLDAGYGCAVHFIENWMKLKN